LYPTGCVNFPIGGGAIAVDFPLLTLPLLSPLSTTGRRNALPLRPTRSAMSTLASVVSLGSPGSTAVAGMIFELERWRLEGGWTADAEESIFLWPGRVVVVADSGAVVSPSSAEASRDSAWTIWSVSISMGSSPLAAGGCGAAAAEVRLRLPEGFCDDEPGDDMAELEVGNGRNTRW
jgi:hypothetical protein